AKKNVEDRLLLAYDKIRRTYRNGLAIVSIERESCGGCFNAVPPQVQAEIRQRTKIIACEKCGRILTDPSLEESVRSDSYKIFYDSALFLKSAFLLSFT